MFISKLIVENWLRFKGRHEIILEPEIYGVTARWTDNERRSNWGGKSALLEAIRFALYGKHRFKSDDLWVTKWDKKGAVTLVLDDATVISRSKTIGSSEKLSVLVKLSKELKGDEAQLYINRVVGMDLADAESTWYIGQKKTSRFITDDPGTRMDVVVGWLRLEPLQKAYDSVSERLSKLLDEIAVLEAQRRAARETMQGVLKSVGIVDNPEAFDELDELINGAALKAKAYDEVVKLFEKQQLDEAESRNVFRDAEEYHRLIEEGKALRRRIDGYSATVPNDEQLAALRAGYEAAVGKWHKMFDETKSKRRLALGDFDGTCPVNSCECPIKDNINSDGALNRGLLQIADAAYTVACDEKNKAEAALAEAQKLARQFAQDALERTRLLDQVAKLRPAAERAPSLREVISTTTAADLLQARQNLAQVETERYSLIASKKMVVIQKAAFDNADKELGPYRQHAQLLREAQQILGRQGAQRRLAEAALSEIEINANYALGQCGIDLELKLQWAREGKGLAKTCEGCGSAFPASQKVKVCTRCGLERGPHLVNEFKVELSNQSGSAEDLAGIAMNFSAADWFRRDRQAAWAMVALDEPLSACDAENAQAVAGHLPGLLRHFGFVQAFIISHTASHVHACPRVLEIEAGPDGSKIVGGQDGSANVSRQIVVEGAVARTKTASKLQPRYDSVADSSRTEVQIRKRSKRSLGVSG